MLRGSAVAGATVRVTGANDAISGGDGSFSAACASCGTVRLAVSAAGYVDRSTTAVAGGGSAAITLIPATFNTTAFNEMARTFSGNGGLTRWNSAPALLVETSLLADIDGTTATDAQLTESEINAAVTQLTGALATLTGGVFSSFSAISQTTTAAGATVDLSRPNTIVVVHYSARSPQVCGQGGPTFDSATNVVSRGRIWLDRAWPRCNPTTATHELGHALGYNHVQATTSIMNTVSAQTFTQFDRDAATIAFRRPAGNRDPDTDPNSFLVNQARPIEDGGRLVTPPPLP